MEEFGNLENEVTVLKKQVACLEKDMDCDDQPKDGRVRFTSLGLRDMDGALAFVRANREYLHFG